MMQTDEVILFDLALSPGRTPTEIEETTGVTGSYLRQRLTQLVKWDRAVKPGGSRYAPTPEGRREILDDLDVGLDLVLAFQTIEQDWQMHSEDDVAVIRFVDGSIQSYRSQGAVAVGDEHIDLRFDPMSSWQGEDEVREDVDAARPD